MMTQEEGLKLAAVMREKAKELRTHIDKNKEAKIVKCAQVLTAVRGLSKLQSILRGEG